MNLIATHRVISTQPISNWFSALEEELSTGIFTYLTLSMFALPVEKKFLTPVGCGVFKEGKKRPNWQQRLSASGEVEYFVPDDMLEVVIVVGRVNYFSKMYFLVKGGKRIIKADYMTSLDASELGPFTAKDFVKP